MGSTIFLKCHLKGHNSVPNFFKVVYWHECRIHLKPINFPMLTLFLFAMLCLSPLSNQTMMLLFWSVLNPSVQQCTCRSTDDFVNQSCALCLVHVPVVILGPYQRPEPEPTPFMEQPGTTCGPTLCTNSVPLCVCNGEREMKFWCGSFRVQVQLIDHLTAKQ